MMGDIADVLDMLVEKKVFPAATESEAAEILLRYLEKNHINTAVCLDYATISKSAKRDMLKIRPCVERAKSEGFQISEYALRQWIRTGAIPARKVGNSFLIYYPNLVRFLQCADGCDNVPPKAYPSHSNRRA